MGGNAVAPYVKTVRLNVVDYKHIEEKTMNLLSESFPNTIARIVEYFSSKSDFGDIDIMYQTPSNEEFLEHLYSVLKDGFNASKELPVVRNGNVTSIGVPTNSEENEYFQLDFLHYHKENWEHAKFFLDYNDVGNLLGRVSRFAGFKLSDKGLIFPYKDSSNQVIKDVLVTKDPRETMSILKVDKSLYDKDIDTMEDVYRLVMSSFYFVPDTFYTENMNRGLRVREKKRGAYKLFVDYLAYNSDIATHYTYDEKETARKQALEDALNNLPDFYHSFHQVEKDHKKNNKFKSLFNGHRIMELTHLQGGELGTFIKYMKGSDEEGFMDKINEMTQEEVDDLILSSLNDFNGM